MSGIMGYFGGAPAATAIAATSNTAINGTAISSDEVLVENPDCEVGALPADSNPGTSLVGRSIDQEVITASIWGSTEKKVTYTAFGALQNTLQSQIRSVMEAAYYAANFVCKVTVRGHNSVELFSSQMGVLKNVLHGAELFVWAPQVWATCTSAVTERSSAAAAAAIQLVGRSFNAIANAVDFAALFLPLRASVVLAFQKVNIGVTGVWSSIGLTKAFQDLLQSDSEDKKTFNLLKIAANASYAAFAVINMTCIALGIVPTNTTPMALMALGLIFDVASHYYEMRNDPYEQNKRKMSNEERIAATGVADKLTA